ncbi:hypothetical protein B0I31_12938 [Saccharothrix carnea]|uniref:Uncharacterized protein n=1 Tax=Saccharothrix carnea TaxID=1280637 RepID=A0A2P8HD23_SACCR|nr:hypothetical protein B0I31_12938 [Saccharothrix carnea]
MVPRHDEVSYLAALAAAGRSLPEAGQEQRAVRDDTPSRGPAREVVRRQRGDQLVGDGDGLDT